MNNVSCLIGFELKKIFTPKKTILTALAVLPLLFLIFVLELHQGVNFEAIHLLQQQYTGSVTSNVFTDAQKRANEMRNQPDNFVDGEWKSPELHQKFEVYEHPETSIRLNEIRQGLHAELLQHTEGMSESELKITQEYSKRLTGVRTLFGGDTMSISFLERFTFAFFPLLMAFLISLFLSSAFSGEYSSQTDSIILASKYGKNRFITAKFAAVFITATLLFLAVMGTYFTLSVLKWGMFDSRASFIFTAGNSFIYLNSPFDFSMGQYFGVMLAISYASTLTYAFFTAYLSSKSEKSLRVSILSMLLVFLPFMVLRNFELPYNWFTCFLKLNFADTMGVRNLLNHFHAMVVDGQVVDLSTLLAPCFLLTSIVALLLGRKSFQHHIIV